MSVKDKISHIVDTWFMYEPLLFNVYCTHKLEENKDSKSPFRTGKRRIEYNPELLEDKSEKEIEALLQIEVTRIILKHPYQRVPQNPNRAALTTASDITIQEHCFHDKNLKNADYYKFDSKLSYEEYYRKLYYICPNIGPNGEDLDAVGYGSVGVNETPSGNKSKAKGLKQAQFEQYQAAADAAELWDEDEELCDSVNQQIQKAQKTNQWGSVSGSFQETITASLRIPMDYRRILSQFRASVISQRRKLTRMKPNRRYGFDFMGSQFEPKTHLLVAVDVSGSIGTEDLQHFFSIINRFFSYGVELIQVIAFDTEIKQEIELKKACKTIKILGRGGTDFQCAIDHYESHPEYQGMIIFTDGYAPTPEVRKAKQTLWILTGRNEYDNAQKWIKDLKGSKATWIPSVGNRNGS